MCVLGGGWGEPRVVEGRPVEEPISIIKEKDQKKKKGERSDEGGSSRGGKVYFKDKASSMS